MKGQGGGFTIEVKGTKAKCPIGEKVGKQNQDEGNIPVFSCEGACIRGEIARLAANMAAKEGNYRRGCHGELFSVPDSAMAEWSRSAKKVVLIDGCFIRCHGRMLKNMLKEENIIHFDALSFNKKYTDRFDIDSVPEEERKEVARSVADWIFEQLDSKQ